MLMERQTVNPLVAVKYLTDGKQFKIFNKEIKYCANKIYNFQANDFCVNGKNCIIEKKKVIGSIFGLINFLSRNHIAEKTECHCPNEKSFKCGKYCTIDSNACNNYRLIVTKKYFQNIKQCDNHNSTYFINYF